VRAMEALKGREDSRWTASREQYGQKRSARKISEPRSRLQTGGETRKPWAGKKRGRLLGETRGPRPSKTTLKERKNGTSGGGGAGRV